MSLKKRLNLDEFVIRKFTKELENTNKTVYDLFNWKKTNVKLVDYKNNKTLFEDTDLEFPEFYSQNACDIIASKYFKRANVPNDRGREYSLKQIVDRMVRFWTEAALEEGLINDDNKQIFYDEIAYTILNQMAAPNSPQWFNTGLKYYNTVENSDGHFYYDEKLGKSVVCKDKYSRTQASACFIIGLEDKLLGNKSITHELETETRLFKHGSGVGANFSVLRAEGEKLSGGGKSSGLLSFLKTFDRNAAAVKSGGTTRRAAKMVTVDLDHPEILDYINWKSRQEDIVKLLGKMGIDTDFNGEAYDIVSGQASNNSVRASNEFMRNVHEYITNKKDFDFELKGRVDDSINKTIKGNELWDSINKATWNSGDPALQFDDIFNEWHTCPAGEDGQYGAKHNRINATNPCSEYAFLDDTACNLASINIIKFYNPTTETFDVESYKHCILLWQMVLEASIHWGQFPTAEIARKSALFRTTGLGIANTASLHLLMAHPYDSDEARAVAASIMSICTGYSYFTSTLMANKIGPFAKFDINKEYMLKVMRNHARINSVLTDDYEGLSYTPQKLNHDILNNVGFTNISKEINNIWTNVVIFGEEYGFRNAQTTVIAPTGTISFAMDCQCTSTEPFFAHVIHKKLSGGGMMKLVNPLMTQALKKLKYNEDEIKVIEDYIQSKKNGIDDFKIEGAPFLKEEHLPIFDTANKCGTGERYITPMGHVKMMAALTPMVSGSISKTVNLPTTATVEDISDIYLKAWELGVKAIAVYRDGCKASQPLNSAITSESKSYEDMKYNELLSKVYELEKEVIDPKRIRPNQIRNARIHEAELNGLKLYITISYFENNKLSELYITADKEGSLIKGLLDSLSKQVSKMFQYNIPVKDIIKSFKGQKYEPHGFVTGHPYIKSADSISDLVAKVLEIEIGDYSSCHVKPEKDLNHKCNCSGKCKTEVKTELVKPETPEIIDVKKNQKVWGMTCSTCGSTDMRKNGTCYVCESCGSTTGCS